MDCRTTDTSSRLFARIGRRTKQIDPLRIYASQVAAACRDAVAIEELQDLDGNLAAVVEQVAQLRGAELPAGRRGGEPWEHVSNLGNGGAQEEMIGRHLIEPRQFGELFAQCPNLLLGD